MKIESTVETTFEGVKADWQRPTVARIDIKRTLIGLGSATDGPSPTT